MLLWDVTTGGCHSRISKGAELPPPCECISSD